MNENSVRKLVEDLAAGRVSIDGALHALRKLPYNDIGVAKVDHHRELRTGVPEVVFGQAKTAAQIQEIMRELYQTQGFALATRLNEEKVEALLAEFPAASVSAARTAVALGSTPPSGAAFAVLTAGSSDRAVGDEAAFTLRCFGHDVVLEEDVGVAGIHRLLDSIDRWRHCEAVIVVAGMEGTLPGVVAGLLPVPVIAVPTSVGYGVSSGGFTALFAMLSSCAPGIAVVNIDNGFGAAAFAHRMHVSRTRREAHVQ